MPHRPHVEERGRVAIRRPRSQLRPTGGDAGFADEAGRRLRSLLRRIVDRVAAGAVILTVAVGAAPNAASATGARAGVVASSSLTSAKWGATVTPTPLTFAAAASQSATVTNVGTIALVGIGYKVTISNPTTGSPTFTLHVCAVAWSSGKCSGGSGTPVGGTFAKNTTTNVTSSVVPPVEGSLYLEATAASVGSSVTMTLATSISSSTQLRARLATNQ